MEESLELDRKETYNGSVWFQKRTLRIALVSSFTGLAVVLGYALAYLPNIEVFTMMIFLGGFILGKRDGLIIGVLSSLIFVILNPYGASPLFLLSYQISHYSLVGLIGGVVKNYLSKKNYFKPKRDLYLFQIMFILGCIGAFITFFYDLISTLIGAFIVTFRFSSFPTTMEFFSQLQVSYNFFIISYIYGIPFTAIHLIGNTLEFIFILPGLISLIYKLLN
ncbi:MAG: hypothetical protein ACFFBH_03500 [Promethearchaeota archaeon]